MAFASWCAVLFTALAADAPVRLAPGEAVGETTRVVVTMRAEGLFKPAADPSPTTKGAAPAESKPLALKVETRLEFADKTLAVGADGAATRSVRRVEKAGAAINGEVRPSASALRPETSTLVAESRGGQGVVVSPGGPLLRSELELVQGPGDPLALSALLPAAAVAKGDAWTVGSDAARSLGGYDTLEDNGLRATLDAIDEAKAVVKLAGAVRGSTLGGSGTIEINGSFTIDRKAGRVASIEVERAEVRKAGPVEAGLDVKSTLKVDRRPVDAPPELTDAGLAGLPLEIKPDRELLLFRSPDGKYSLVHDRDWHIYWDSARQTILKRLRQGQVVAHCTLSAGPNAGKGRHQDPGQLRDDIRKAAGARFVRLAGEGEVGGPADGGYRYKVAVQGKEGPVEVLWYYYSIASAEGEQVLAVFTLALSGQADFGDEDLRLIGSFAWTEPPAKPQPD